MANLAQSPHTTASQKCHVLFVELEMERNWSVASIGPAFLAAYVRQFGHEVEIIHLSVDSSAQDAIQTILQKTPDVLALSLTSRQWLRAKEIVNTLRKVRDIPTIVGGLHPTFAADSVLLEPGVDFACLGEGERAFAAFLDHIHAHPTDKTVQINNIQCKGQSKPTLFPPIEDINSIPFMARDMLREQYGVVHMCTQRGCPFPCSYCAARMYNELYDSAEYGRRRSLDNVFAELRDISATSGINYIIFLDDTFTLHPKWVEKFCIEYPKEFSAPFSLHARVETINQKMLENLAKAGCKHITYGVESGSERVRRDIMKRRVSNERLINAFQWTKDVGIITTANYILGSPTETGPEIEETLALHKVLDPHDFGYFMFYPYPGTPLYHYCVENKLLPENFYDMPANHRNSVLRHDVLSPSELEYYYQRFTTLREESYVKRYGQFLQSADKDTVKSTYTDSANVG